jgi:protein SFI1
VPFLASASSDLDEGFDGDGESLVGAGARPSPRRNIKVQREAAKSMVGYSPSASVDYDFASLTAPIRTSTPVNRQQGSPSLPPYSVSDVSEILDVDESGSHRTPRAGDRQLEEEELDEDVMREMERRADEFFETGLRGRCWDVWAQASDWVQVSIIAYKRMSFADMQKTSEQIDTVRSNILLRQTLARWRAVHHHNLTLPNTADAHRTHHLKAAALSKWMERLKAADLAKRGDAFEERAKRKRVEQAWSRWRNRLIKIRTQKWTRDMASREKAFICEKEEKLLSIVLQVRVDTLCGDGSG